MKTDYTKLVIACGFLLVGILAGIGLKADSTLPCSPNMTDSVQFKVFRARNLGTHKIEPVYLDLNTVYRSGDTISVNDNHVIPAIPIKSIKDYESRPIIHQVILESQIGIASISRDKAEEQQ